MTETITRFSASATERTDVLFQRYENDQSCFTSRMFAALMVFQWLIEMLIAALVSPLTWNGSLSETHPHVWAAVVLGGGICSLPVCLAFLRPGAVSTWYVVAVGQMLTSALLIHLTGGRIETHFHIFGSLAFLAFYRDWRVLVVASAVIAGDHLLRGFFWPESVYGTAIAGTWRWVEHAGWVLFEDFFLMISIVQERGAIRKVAEHQVGLELANESIEVKVQERTFELAASQEKLRQAQKLESVGQLAAGMAHEINTPIQFIGDNTRFLRDAFADLQRVLGAGDRLLAAARQGAVTPELISDMEEVVRQADTAYLCIEIPSAIQQSAEGLERVASIVRAMKEFSHPGGNEKTATDINKAIDNTLIVARNEWKYVADAVTDLDPSLPLVACLPGEVNQVILNLIVNAAHAISDVVGGESGQKGTITIGTRATDNGVEIRVRDTGCGIPMANRSRIFDPFFTTKPVGKGTGQGLTITHAVVVRKHGGTITFETELGKGTTFIVWLPLEQSTEMAA